MAKQFSSLAGFCASILPDINQKVDEALRRRVAPFVKKVMKEHIQSDVYDVYEPKVYERRKTRGGLIDGRKSARAKTPKPIAKSLKTWYN
jgi:hypothetical protein